MQGKKPKQIRDSNAFAGIAVFGIVTLLVVVLFSTLPETPTPTEGIPHNYWVPTEEDIQELDSLHNIVKETNTDLDTVRRSLDRCLDKLDVLIESEEVIHWERVDGEMIIYTREDSIRDERERWRYIDSIERADENYIPKDPYSEWMNKQ